MLYKVEIDFPDGDIKWFIIHEDDNIMNELDWIFPTSIGMTIKPISRTNFLEIAEDTWNDIEPCLEEEILNIG